MGPFEALFHAIRGSHAETNIFSDGLHDRTTAEKLERLASMKQRSLNDHTRAFLEDRFAKHVRSDIFDFADEAIKSSELEMPGKVRTVLGVIKMIHQVDRARSADSASEQNASLAGALDDPTVKAFLKQWYEIPDTYELEQHATIFRAGSTSFIVRCKYRGNDTALKLLHPGYRQATTIKHENVKYLERAKILKERLEDAFPVVYYDDSAFGYIGMEFIVGQTIAEFVEERCREREQLDKAAGMSRSERAPMRLRPVLRHQNLKDTDMLVRALTYILRHLDAPHHDLSPSNIILRKHDPQDLVLIDFGKNFVFEEGIGSEKAYERMRPYVAPELAESGEIDNGSYDEADHRADQYSLGVILLEVIFQRSVLKEDRAEALKVLWEEAPGLAEVVEDLVEPRPDLRAALAPRSDRPESVYVWVQRRVELEVAVLEAIGVGTGHRDPFVPIRTPWHLFAREKYASRLGAVAEAAERTGVVDRQYSEFTKLARWERAYALLWGVCYVLAIALTLLDSGLEPHLEIFSAHDIERIVEFAGFVEIGEWSENLPGRLVALSTAAIAFAYYLNLFSSISARTTSLKVELLTRCCPFLAILLQVVCIVFAPSAFGLFAGLGGLLIVANNYAWLNVVKQANANGGEEVGNGRDAVGGRYAFEPRMREWALAFEKSFAAWWPLMAVYSFFGGIALWLLLVFEVADDVWVYALVLALGINGVKLFVFNAVRPAREVRANFRRSVFTLERVRALPPSPETAS